MNEDEPIQRLRESERHLEEAIANLQQLSAEIHESVGFLEQLKKLGRAIQAAVAEQDKAVEGVWQKNDLA